MNVADPGLVKLKIAMTSPSGSSGVAIAAATHGEGEVARVLSGGDPRVRLRAGCAPLIG